MKAFIEQSVLFSGIQTASRAVPPRPTLPIIGNLLIEAEGDHLRLLGTDLDLSISTRLPAEVEEPGTLTVPARKLSLIVRELPSLRLSIEIQGERMILRSPHGQYILTGIPGDNFPAPPSEVGGFKITMDGQLVRSMIERTAFAVSDDETRPALSGVFWQFHAGGHDSEESPARTSMTATDGHRLARLTVSLSTPVDTDAEAILPSKALHHVARLSAAGLPLQGVTLAENYVLFDFEDTVLFTRSIEGPYPDIDQVIPRHNKRQMVISNEELQPAVRRAAILSDPETHQVRLALRPNSLQLFASSQDIGAEATETLAARYEGDDLDIGYDAHYLLDILRNMESEEVIFDLDTPVSAGIIRPLPDNEGQEYLCLIMPLRLTD